MRFPLPGILDLSSDERDGPKTTGVRDAEIPGSSSPLCRGHGHVQEVCDGHIPGVHVIFVLKTCCADEPDLGGRDVGGHKSKPMSLIPNHDA